MKQSDAVFVCEFLVFAFLEWFVISSIECERVETESNAKEIVRNFSDVETDGSERVIDALQSSVPVGEAQFV
jgi:ferritin